MVIALVVFLVWAGAAAWLLEDAGTHMEDGHDALDQARDGATPASLVDPATDASLAEADHHFDQARSRLRNPLVAPLRIVPVVGRHIRSADRIVATAAGATEVATVGVADLRALTEQPLSTGPERVAALEELADLMARTHEALADLDPGTPNALIAPVSEAVVELTEERDDARADLQRAEAATRALVDVLRGPTPYLLLGSNNGEMRAGAGMYLSATTLEFSDGAFTLGDIQPTQQLVLPSGTVRADGDLATNWPWLDPGRDFRNLALSADFPQSAALAARMWQHVPGGRQVGGVIAVDVDALRGLIRVVGPVEVDGVEYTADTVRGQLLREQYDRYDDDREERRDRLGEVARAVFARFESGDWELASMATALTDAVQGRHLMVWSTDEAAQDAWAGVGADGHLTDSSVSVSLLNRGANKLDSYVDTHLDVAAERQASGSTLLRLTYEITNGAPDGGPTYVIGPNIDGMVAGEYRGIVVANLPAGSTDVAIDGVRPTLSGVDGPTVTIGGDVTLPRGASTSITITAVVPPAVTSVTLEASARIPRPTLKIGDDEPEVDRRRTIDLTTLSCGDCDP